RAAPVARRRLANRIAEASGENFLYAFHVTRDLLSREAPITDSAEIRMPAGLWALYSDYLSREVADDRLDEEWRRQVRPVLSLLARARGDGLTVRQIARALPEMTGKESPDAHIVDALHAVGQFLSWPEANGPARIWHSSFRDFLMQDNHFGILHAEANVALAQSLLGTWKERWNECDESYALAQLPGHLIEALRDTGDDVFSQLLSGLLTDLSFGRTKTAALGVDAYVADIRDAVAVTPEPGQERLAELLEAVDGVAHELKFWDAGQAPGIFDQQLLLRADQSGLGWLSEACIVQLGDLRQPYLKYQWRTPVETRAVERVITGHQDWVWS